MLIMFVAPALFVLGFGADKTHKAKPRQTDLARIVSKESVAIETEPGETVWIYADSYTVYRNDAVIRVEDADGNEIPTSAPSGQKPVVLDGKLVSEFQPVVLFTAPGGTVTVDVDTQNASGAPGEFFIGPKVGTRGISLLMPLFFILGTLAMALGLWIAIRNILARKKWFEEHKKSAFC